MGFSDRKIRLQERASVALLYVMGQRKWSRTIMIPVDDGDSLGILGRDWKMKN